MIGWVSMVYNMYDNLDNVQYYVHFLICNITVI